MTRSGAKPIVPFFLQDTTSNATSVIPTDNQNREDRGMSGTSILMGLFVALILVNLLRFLNDA